MNSPHAALSPLLLLTALACNVSPPAASPGSPAEPTRIPYGTNYSWQTSPMGFYETGLALADINHDGYPDLIASSGNDGGLQPLTVYLNDKKGTFPLRPSWMSSDLDANMNLAVGDIDHDGFLDVAVATLGQGYGQGGVKVYFNHEGTLEKAPSYRTEERFSAFACALGDADGDGDLDLAASVMSETGAELKGYARIYYSDGKRPSEAPGWTAKEAVFGGGILFADVQQDGLLDLVQGSSQVTVFAGVMSADGTIHIEREKPWWSSDSGGEVLYLAAGPIGVGRSFGLVASRNSALGSPGPRYEAFLPRPGDRKALWFSLSQGLGSGVRLADVDGDGVSDLLGGAWGNKNITGGLLEIYLGSEGAFADRAGFTSDPQSRSIIQSIDVADLAGRCTSTRTFRTTISRTQAVITVPEAVIGPIARVALNGGVLPAKEYASIPSASWISFARRLKPDDTIEVSYAYPRRVDIATANQDCSIGSYLYYYSAPDCSREGTEPGR